MQDDEYRPDPSRWFWAGFIPLLSGMLWLALGWGDGLVLGLITSVTGVLLTASGAALLLWPGDRQLSHYMAFGALLGVLLVLPSMFFVGFLNGVLLGIAAAASFVVAGYAALYQDVPAPGVPTVQNSLGMAAKVAIDEALLAYFVFSAQVPTGAKVARDRDEIAELTSTLAEQGWLQNPSALHQTPEAPTSVDIQPRRAGGENFEQLSFDSGFEARPELPGAQRWQQYTSNRRVHAWMLRHEGEPRPWVMGIHGYRMGEPFIDFGLFDANYLHRKLGLNLILPILPLHGPRRAYSRSGSGYLDGPMVNMLHAETQAAWDLRRILAWLRTSESAPQIGVMGYSLGGYNTALLASLEADLACAIAGIPLTDMAAAVWRHMPELHRRHIRAQGLDLPSIQRALTPVSPLALTPQVAQNRRFIFAATGDQLVPTDQALRLWEHWGKPECHWYQGSHLSVRRDRGVRRFVADSLVTSGLAQPSENARGAAYSS